MTRRADGRPGVFSTIRGAIFAIYEVHYPPAEMLGENSTRLARECALYRGLLQLNSKSALEPFLRDALSLIVQVAGAEQGYLELFQPGHASGEKRWAAAAGCTEAELAEIQSLVSRGIIAEALVSGETILTPSALLDPRFSERGSVKSANIHAVLCAPIGRAPPVGVLYLQRRAVQDMFTTEDAACAELFATHLSPLVHLLFDRQRFDIQKDPTRSYRTALKVEPLVGASKAMASLLHEISLVSPLEVCVLLTGATGSGKTQVARTIHDNSPRAQQPFVELNCAALPESLVESELFGALPGAHSTANRKMEGKVSAASGGTLFLDDIAELNVPAQAKLLQLLQTGQYYPLGATQASTANVRVIAATHVNLKTAVAERKFREDLFYRLHVLPVRVPSLSERTEDIPMLAKHFCELAQRRHRLRALELSSDALLVLATTEWPGNVRELCHSIEAACIRAAADDSPQVEVSHLALGTGSLRKDARTSATFHAATRAFQRKLLSDTLESVDGNVSEAARRLDLTRGHVYTLLRSLGLDRTKP